MSAVVLLLSSLLQIAFANESLRPTHEVDYLHEVPLSAESSKQIIADIINSHDLKGEKTTTRWELTPLDFEAGEGGMPEWVNTVSVIFATLVEYALWILLAIGLVLLYLSRNQWLHLLTAEKKDEETYQAPDVLFGMDVREASLPDDIIATAKTLWEQQQPREALGLLYRGALIRLLNQEKISLESSHTEGDILNLSQTRLAENKQHYLRQLTTQWQQIAYAHRNPSDDVVQWLFSHWQSDFSYIAASTEDKQ